MENIFFSILSSQKFIDTRQKDIKNTWLLNYKNYTFASDIESEDNAKLSERTDAISGEEKQINSFKYLYDNKKGFDWYFFCDDDTFVNINNLSSFINENKNMESFGYLFSYETCPENSYVWSNYGKDFQYYSGGAGFCLRSDALQKVASCTTSVRTKYGDVTSGILFKEAKINLHHCQRMNLYSPGRYNHSSENIKHSLTYHYIKDEMMYDLYNFIERKNVSND